MTERDESTVQPIKVFLSFEPDQEICAERITSWPRTNDDFAEYNRRMEVDFESSEAGAIRERLKSQIEAADVTICIIAGLTRANPWINWEMKVSREHSQAHGLVGILLKDHVEPPPEMTNCGSIFVTFRKLAVEKAVTWTREAPRDDEDFTLQDD